MANIDHSRRAFFRRPAALITQSVKEEDRTENSLLPQRPPWALKEATFIDQCTRCNECITACKENIIFVGDGGFPEIDFNRGECTFCEDCVDTCKPSALFKRDKQHANSHAVQQPFYFDININNFCLAKQKTHCQSCKDACDTGAITMPWPKIITTGAIQTPEIKIEDCTSCGACISICPSHSIRINPIASPELNNENQ